MNCCIYCGEEVELEEYTYERPAYGEPITYKGTRIINHECEVVKNDKSL